MKTAFMASQITHTAYSAGIGRVSLLDLPIAGVTNPFTWHFHGEFASVMITPYSSSWIIMLLLCTSAVVIGSIVVQDR